MELAGPPHLGVVLQDDRDVHVDDDEHGQQEVEDHEDDGGHAGAAVARVAHVRVLRLAVQLAADGQPGLSPTRRGANL